ncbi:pre-rrna processing protein esf1 [Plasmopara halstedii]|uniref:Pre-rrna processing protein esf1 n=1 Tax=Plasmopara halstedii TaxID=4781 RepID=A0A0P1AE44_PLAHL|nr:pre-rrna processing protein esf1 [Plasmopara halstedii]CEG38704.1 pre-rrna processing protein esf1 [Plasmopara halstedii]|eukprot:XP_024575073.1 pre-rrna processing protein esf1 [Plasmopara halstedii]
MVEDQRFRKVHNDPRFARNSKRKSKLQIDQRFAAALKDERFQSVQGKYDKYGRCLEKKDSELNKFYHLDEEDDEVKLKTPVISGSDDDNENPSTTVAKTNEKLSRLDYLNRMARGELESDSESSDSEDSDNEELQVYDKNEEEEIPMGEETKRFAVLNCDWTRIRAVDLFALCQSFAPSTGTVQNVKIYPSDYGLEKMKEEEQHGPQGLWDDKQEKSRECTIEKIPERAENAKMNATGKKGTNLAESDTENGNSDNSDPEGEDPEGEEDYDSDDPLGVKKSVTLEEKSEGFDSEKLRKYELQKLRYYYAIVTCDSVKTASTIFDQCDQLEYETSSNVLDLRYVPDDTTFTNTPKDTCDSVPDQYKPAIFATLALQQTDIKLTWEEDDDQRLELLTRPGDWKDAQDDDFKAYLASDVSSSSEVDNSDSIANTADPDSRKTLKNKAKLKKLSNRYRSMLLGSDAEDKDEDKVSEGGYGDSSEEEGGADADGNMELSFTPGASDILKTKRQKELEENETPFERYAREKKQKKNRKLHEKRSRQKELEREQREVLKKKGRGAKEANLLREAIIGGDDSGAEESENDLNERDFDMKKIAKQEKVKYLKGKRRAKEMKKLAKHKGTGGLQEDFQFDASDPRFSGLYSKSSHFQLDPTDPKFKKSEATLAIFKERRQRYDQDASSALNSKAFPTTTVNSKQNLNAMVENLKRKSQQQDKKKNKKNKI